ncbi:Uncharacterized protein SVXHr_1923 [Halorhabdus sp. SVX81]|uniref:hypothetical protein n=1 Tax=Halorhabdus sp. SVX81 TaxID=2978283 RepID=UPI0023DC043A|nr:hypothetical protein [Halorhabdus sp. SVX81]WEL18085.1 Uncharacterized protein SVXHr_1923 [Halorhabdus sp. SVX81]
MYSRAHAAISLVVAGGVVLAGEPTVDPALAVGYGVALGVLIDLDHFVLAWLLAGSTTPLRRVLRAPWIVVTDPATIFDTDDLGPYHRLISHVVIAGVLVPGVWLAVDPFLGVLSAAVLWAHLLADLIADVRNFETIPRDGRQP